MKISYLENETHTSIQYEKEKIIYDIPNITQEQKKMIGQLNNYRFVDEINNLHVGKYVRWIRKSDPISITNGGIITNIFFLNTGIHVQIYNKFSNTKLQYKFDDVFTYQKISKVESIILSLQS